MLKSTQTQKVMEKKFGKAVKPIEIPGKIRSWFVGSAIEDPKKHDLI